MLWLEMRMYLRKQSLDHLPRLIISHLGQPMAAAVVAAPIRSECEVVLARPSVVSVRIWLMSFLVRNFWSWYAKRGPDFEGCRDKYLFIARTG